MRFLKLLMLALLVSSEVFAQSDTLEYYLNTSDRKIEPKDALYYRRAWKEGEWWRVKDYCMSTGTLKSNGIFASHSKDTFTVQQGMFYFYHENGTLQKKVRYIDGRIEGIVKEYNEYGRIVDSGYYKKGIPYKARFGWNDSGVIVFKGLYAEDGSGIGEEWEYTDGKITGYGKTGPRHLKDSVWTFNHKNGVISSIERYDMDSLIAIQCFDNQGRPSTDSCSPERMPEPKGNLLQYIAENMLYPNEARQNEIEGRVYLQFIVNEDGSVTNVKSIGRYLGGGCVEEAIRVVSSMPKWKPGKSHNRPVKVYYMQPVSFRLE